MEKNWICYCLQSKNYTYVGITNNFARRHRQHNGEIKGGARYTRAHRPWTTLFQIIGLQTHQQVLQLEWAMKHRRKGKGGIHGRFRTLEYLLSLDKWTKRAPLLQDLTLTIRVYMTKKEYLKHAKLEKVPKRKNIYYQFKKE